MRFLLSFTAIVVCFTAVSQNPGYFDKKNSFDFYATGQYPLVSNLLDVISGKEVYKKSGTELEEKRDHFDYGFRFTYMRTLKRNFGMGVEIGTEYFSSQRNYIEPEMYTGNYLLVDRTNIRCLTIMPKLEFSNKGGLLPMGIAHQIGLGINLFKPADRQYYYQHSGYNNVLYPPETIEVPVGNEYKGKRLVGVTAMYAVNMRTPLTKFLFLNYGLRYTLNFLQSVAYTPPPSSDPNVPVDYFIDPQDYHNNSFEINKFELRYLVKERKQFSFIQASLGLTFVF